MSLAWIVCVALVPGAESPPRFRLNCTYTPPDPPEYLVTPAQRVILEPPALLPLTSTKSLYPAPQPDVASYVSKPFWLVGVSL